MNFDHSAVTYKPDNAYILAQISDLAYKRYPVIRQTAKVKYGLDRFIPFFKNSTDAYILADDSKIIISFRGTEITKRQDRIADLNFPYVKGPWGRVHGGFQGALNFIWPKMIKLLKKLRNNNEAVWITGHSLGGALAMLSAAHLWNEGISAQGVYTFGQPRVGNNVFANTFYKRFGRKYCRFVNNQDIVPHVPSFLPAGYRHLGNKCFYFDEKGTLNTDYDYWKKVQKMYLGMIIGTVTKGPAWFAQVAVKSPGAIRDHGMQNYLSNLKKAISA